MICRIGGHWLYSNRKWLNPAEISGRLVLEKNYDFLESIFPKLLAQSKAAFLAHLSEETASVYESECNLQNICQTTASSFSKVCGQQFNPANLRPCRAEGQKDKLSNLDTSCGESLINYKRRRHEDRPQALSALGSVLSNTASGVQGPAEVSLLHAETAHGHCRMHLAVVRRRAGEPRPFAADDRHTDAKTAAAFIAPTTVLSSNDPADAARKAPCATGCGKTSELLCANVQCFQRGQLTGPAVPVQLAEPLEGLAARMMRQPNSTRGGRDEPPTSYARCVG